MANRYWRGGSGTWNTTLTTNWSATSGGAGGASVPTSADDVFFDQAGTYTVTCTGTRNCKSLTVSAGTVTFAQGTSPLLNIYGSLSLISGTVWNTTGVTTFRATTSGNTITTNGTLMSGGITFNGIGGEWTLGSALSFPSATTTKVLFTAGALFSTANYNISNCNNFINAGFSGTLDFGSSTITIGGSLNSTPLTLSSGGLTTYTANTATFEVVYGFGIITIADNGAVYNLNIKSLSAASAVTLRTQLGTISLNNLTLYSQTVSATGSCFLTVLANEDELTVSGTFSTSGTTYNNRILVGSTTGNSFMTVAAASLADVDFACMNFKGTATPISGTRLGNGGNVSGVTFNAGRTVYWNQAAGGNWTDNAWASSSGGTPSTTYYPLPQDTAIIENTGLNTSATITTINGQGVLPSINSSTRTNAATFTVSGVYFYGGSVYIGSGVTYNSSFRMFGESTVYIKSDSSTNLNGFLGYSPTATYELLSNITGTGNSGISFGKLKLSTYKLSVGNFTFGVSSYNGTVANGSIDFGSGTLEITGSIGMLSGTYYGVNVPGSGKVSFTNSGGPLFGHTSAAWPIVEIASTATSGLVFTGGGTATIKDLRVLTTTAIGISFNANPSITFNSFTPSGTAGNLISFYGPATLTKGSTWYVGANSVNVSGNTGLVFTAGGGVDYLRFQDITAVVVIPPAPPATANFLVFF